MIMQAKCFRALAGEAQVGGLFEHSCRRSLRPSDTYGCKVVVSTLKKKCGQSVFTMTLSQESQAHLKLSCCSTDHHITDKVQTDIRPACCTGRCTVLLFVSEARILCFHCLLHQERFFRRLQAWFMEAASGQSPQSFSSISPVLLKVTRLRIFSCRILQ